MAQSTSSSTGPAKSIVTRMVSAPHSSMSGPGSTTFPLLLLMAAPSMITIPWFRSLGKGSRNDTRPRSWRTLVKKRE